MKCIRLMSVLSSLAICLGCWTCRGADSIANLDSVLEKWEQASRACRTLDARLTIFRYGTFCPDCPETSYGRYYYESPNFARYEILANRDGKQRDSSSATEAMVWTDEGLYLVDHRTKTCRYLSSRMMTVARESVARMPERTWWDRFQKGLAMTLYAPAEFPKPEDYLPLFLNTGTLAQRQRFDLKAENRDGHVILVATPKQKSPVFREIDVMLDKDSYRIVAHQAVATSGDRTVHLFDDLKINKPPADRDTLLRPIPAGYRVFREGE